MLILTALIHVRSPLLAESLLISFPEGTEMFHFPSFALYKYSNMNHSILGCPIRKPPDQSLLTAPRGLSQPSTSFIASTNQGIHHSPLVTYLYNQLLQVVIKMLLIKSFNCLKFYIFLYYSKTHHFLIKCN